MKELDAVHPAPRAQQDEGPMPHVVLQERASSGEARCAFCHDEQRGALVECSRCGVVVHAECRSPSGPCMTLGCTSRAAHPTDGAAGAAEVYAPRYLIDRGALRAVRGLFLASRRARR